MKKIMFLLIILTIVACSKSSSSNGGSVEDTELISNIKNLNVSKEFNFNTSQVIDLELIGLDTFEGKAIDIYEGFINYGEGVNNNGDDLLKPLNKKLGEFIFDKDASIKRKVEVDGTTRVITVTGLLGYADLYIEISNGRAYYNYITKEGLLQDYPLPNLTTRLKNVIGYSNNFQTLGGWDYNGKPTYNNFDSVNVNQEIIDGINITLAERQNVPIDRPELIDLNGVYNIELSEDDAEVWVTFLHEGAGWKNVLAYYVYDLADGISKPDAEDLIIVFPNTSFSGSGGGLSSGNRVQLKYPLVNGTYADIFPKGKGIAWVLLGNWWGTYGSYSGSGAPNNFYQKPTVQYSNREFNVDQKQQTILLYSSQGSTTNGQDTIILAFEDIIRTWTSCDQDFNDAIFQVDVSPFTAIAPSTIDYWQTNEVTVGSEGETAYYEYSPAQGQYSTLAYEDLWPTEGDYDFNDMVVDYNLALKRNEANELVSLTMTNKVRAVGATQRNGLFFELDIDPDLISKVKIDNVEVDRSSYIEKGDSGLNPNPSTIIKVFNDAHSLFSLDSGFINTEGRGNKRTPAQISVTIEFNSGIKYDSSLLSSFNPFLRVNSHFGYKDREVHLAGYKPSTFGARAKLNTGDDMTDQKGYYKNINGLPWGIKIFNSTKYPSEGNQITSAYNYFFQWASTEGASYPDWYRSDYSGYANQNKLYQE